MRKSTNFVPAIKYDQGEMPEWSIGAVSKTVVPFGTQGSNPCLSACKALTILRLSALCTFKA